MGIIILPFILGAIAIVIISLMMIVKQFKTKTIGIKEILLGFILSWAIFGLIALSYFVEGSAWALSPAFRIPIYMVFIPFVLYILSKSVTKPKIKYFSMLLLISIVCSGLMALLFYDLFFGIIDHLGIEKHY